LAGIVPEMIILYDNRCRLFVWKIFIFAGQIFPYGRYLKKEGLMIDLIKKTFYTGLGVVALTKEKIEELADELVEKGKLSESDVKKFVDDLFEKSESAKDQVKKHVEKITEDTLNKMNLVTKDNLDALEKRLTDKIEKKTE
jgi:polyhydroxyalkanoate synthesis regulator phasin